MYIEIRDLITIANKHLEIPCNMENLVFEYMGNEYPITEIKPFDLCLTNDSNKELLISGETSLKMILSCDRCLEDVPMDFDISIDRKLKIDDGIILADEDGDDDFVNENQLDVDRLIFDEILVNWPAKVLCKDDCKGICLVCGQNLNIQDCGCNRQVIDPRMAAFQDVFDQFKEV
ncbi:MAG: DUF177 domain-containing protein [Lachnospiraceae bacterium]|jgi:uncharacterized protein|nr:DUF177 domain-containing protein [Lachnospiraceae bacterium]